MKKYSVKGKVKLLEKGKLMQYGLYRGLDMYNLDEMLWENTYRRNLGIEIRDKMRNVLVSGVGKLVVDYKDGYEKYMFRTKNKIFNLDEILWGHVDDYLEFTFTNYKLEGERRY